LRKLVGNVRERKGEIGMELMLRHPARYECCGSYWSDLRLLGKDQKAGKVASTRFSVIRKDRANGREKRTARTEIKCSDERPLGRI